MLSAPSLRILGCPGVSDQGVGSNEMVEALLNKGFARCFQKTDPQVLRKKKKNSSLLVQFWKLNFLLGSEGVYPAPHPNG